MTNLDDRDPTSPGGPAAASLSAAGAGSGQWTGASASVYQERHCTVIADELVNRALRVFLRRAKRAFFQDRENPVAIDYGCGAGGRGSSPDILKQAGFEVIGFDASAVMVQQAREWDPEGNYNQADCSIEHAKLPVASESADLILNKFVFMEIQSLDAIERVLLEEYRVLNDSGLNIIVVPDKAFYNPRHTWHGARITLEDKYPPESGSDVTVELSGANGKDVVVHDKYWSVQDLIDASDRAGFKVILTIPTVALDGDLGEVWFEAAKEEAPFVVLVLQKKGAELADILLPPHFRPPGTNGTPSHE